VWDTATGDRVQSLDMADAWPWSVALNADGSLVAVGGEDMRVHVFDTVTGEEVLALESTGVALSIDFSRDGSRIVSAGRDSTARIWDARTGDLLAVLTHSDWVRVARFSPDGSQVVTGSDDGTAVVWDARTGDALYTLAQDVWVTSAAYSSDGTRLVTADGNDSIRVWDATSAKLIAEVPPHTYNMPLVALNGDGTRLAVASLWGDANLYLWKLDADEVFQFIGERLTALNIPLEITAQD
jgi:WD40 repeat protein